jgi:glucosamine--fructose-6-phosphate aminotransferase (isomerizing)
MSWRDMNQVSDMARETREAGAVVAMQLAANRAGIRRAAQRIRELDPRIVVTVARGSSDYASLYLKYVIEILAGIPCASLGPSIASLYRTPLRLDGALAIAISQSGRSPDIVSLQAAVKKGGALTVALVNDVDAPLAQAADCLLPLHAGPEKSVAATKSVIAAMAAGIDLIAEWRGDSALSAALGELSDALGAAQAPPDSLVDALSKAKSLFVLGRGPTYAIAAEAALKLKETCAIHAEAFSSAEVLHGPAGVIVPGFPILAFMPQDAARAGMAETLERLTAMAARVLVVDAAPAQGAAMTVQAAGHPLLTPVVMLHRFYGLVESCARALGRDPDNPPNLRKVTETR